MDKNTPIPVIIGPTAVGKTQFSIKFALSIGAEIISCDSRQVYIGMDIGTAKPPYSIRQTIPHHLIDVVYPDQEFNAQIWKNLAQTCTETIIAKGRVPLIVCGTPLYLSAFVNGFFHLPNLTTAKRKQLKLKIENLKKTTSLFDFLRKIDRKSSQKIHPNDSYRIQRAIEIYLFTGKTRSFYESQEKQKNGKKLLYIGLNMNREKLYERINNRVDAMLKSGLIEEVEHLISIGYSQQLNALHAPGYREIIQYIQGGIDLEQTVSKIKTSTRNYAKRQLTWFRKTKGVQWFDIYSADTEALKQSIALYKRSK